TRVRVPHVSWFLRDMGFRPAILNRLLFLGGDYGFIVVMHPLHAFHGSALGLVLHPLAASCHLVRMHSHPARHHLLHAFHVAHHHGPQVGIELDLLPGGGILYLGQIRFHLVQLSLHLV